MREGQEKANKAPALTWRGNFIQSISTAVARAAVLNQTLNSSTQPGSPNFNQIQHLLETWPDCPVFTHTRWPKGCFHSVFCFLQWAMPLCFACVCSFMHGMEWLGKWREQLVSIRDIALFFSPSTSTLGRFVKRTCHNDPPNTNRPSSGCPELTRNNASS